MRRDGFTLLELLITFTVMVILMALAVVMLRTTQANARDEERASDIATIARGLENRYERNSLSRGDVGSDIETEPGYPSVDEIRYVSGETIPTGLSDYDPWQSPNPSLLTDNLPGTEGQSFMAPSEGKFTVICSSSCPAAETPSMINSATSGGNTHNYVYEPVTADGAVCMTINDECVRYNLYYRTEVDGALHTVRSRHQ